MPGEFHISGLWNSLIFWGGFFVGLFGLLIAGANFIVGLIIWLVGIGLIVWMIIKNKKSESNKSLNKANIALKVVFLALLVLLMFFMNIL